MMLSLKDCALSGKRVLIREDLNVPMDKHIIQDDSRITACLPTIQYALQEGAAVLLLSHLGRPQEGHYDKNFSLAPVATYLNDKLGQPVTLLQDFLHHSDLKMGQVALAENIRFQKGESSNDETLARQMAALCDIFVMDAFASAHRAHASTVGITRFAPVACAGPLLLKEITTLTRWINNPKKTTVAIVGGSKISTKIKLLKNLIPKVDYLLVGGGIANAFIAALGHPIGQSLCEDGAIDIARDIQTYAKQYHTHLGIPTDGIVAPSPTQFQAANLKSIDAIDEQDSMFDIGPNTIEQWQSYINKADHIMWNGPVGLFEIEAFSKGTQAVARAVAKSSAFSLAGGGDTLAALQQYQYYDQVSYCSTGGGAFLSFLEGNKLPAIEALEKRAR